MAAVARLHQDIAKYRAAQYSQLAKSLGQTRAKLYEERAQKMQAKAKRRKDRQVKEALDMMLRMNKLIEAKEEEMRRQAKYADEIAEANAQEIIRIQAEEMRPKNSKDIHDLFPMADPLLCEAIWQATNYSPEDTVAAIQAMVDDGVFANYVQP